ncbi:unnamed protein product [Bursaphelenchus okinawaensis]|uniref:SKI-interacting protein SKIP SNW domain-containing protein n=1 Tax=Bursaphelenchus okinawaensis TaxID=465554 RepID=A0A811LGV7_9BILA|nr:unnamed protein product [Bursaphelenchus okinawaensis]CAG9122161.1 unnamed protein product [Bursaphelenchus okinawaensis]
MSIKLADILPAPVNARDDLSSEVTRDSWFKGREDALENEIKAVVLKSVPPYGQRSAYTPRVPEDYGDGGAFPEIHIAQFPLGMGSETGLARNVGANKTLALQYDKDGKLRHDAIAKIGHGKDKIVHTRLQNTKQRAIDPEDPELQRPSQEEIEETMRKTKEQIEKITNAKIASALPVQHAKKTEPAQYIRYTPSQQNSEGTSQQRIIRMVEAQRDPMEPPRFQINQKIPRAPPSPPAPVLHSPPRKVTQKEQADWKIPPCISNWKNPKGFTVGLDKRLAADGRGLQQVHINENFAKLSEALQLAQRTAREGVEARNQMEKRIADNKRLEQEKKMMELAKEARANRQHKKPQEDDEGVARRDEIRKEKMDEIRRERNLTRGRPDAAEKLKRDRERDISEKVALGLPGTKDKSGETQFDHRLFNKDAGLDSGAMDEDTYNVYDQPWRTESNVQSIYRPRKQAENPYGDDLDEIVKQNRFQPDRGFKGAEPVLNAAPRNGPVEFEVEKDDIFGIGDLFKTKDKRKDTEDAGPSSKKSRR